MTRIVVAWISFVLVPKVNAAVVPILQVGKLWLREISMPSRAEAEPEASSVRLQRQSLELAVGKMEQNCVI